MRTTLRTRKCNQNWIIAGVLIAVYLIHLIVFYPGVCGYDTVNQIDDFFTGTEPRLSNWVSGEPISATLNDHHPVTTTLIFAFFTKLGMIFGNVNFGMAIFNCCQILIMAFLFSHVICSAKKWGMKTGWTIVFLIYYLMPVNSFFAITMIKDTLFAVAFLVFYLVYTQIVRDVVNGEKEKNEYYVFLLIFSILIALLNKKGMYIALISNLFLVFLSNSKKQVMKALIAAIAPMLIITVLLGKILFPIFNVYPGGKQEALGFAFQQTARTMIDHPQDFSDEEKNVFYNVLQIQADELQDLYDNSRIDSIKDTFNASATNSDIKKFIALWIKKGISHPVTYVRATFEVCGGYFVPIKSFNVYTKATYADSIGGFNNPDALKGAREFVIGIFKALKKVPGIGILFQNSIYTWWIPLVVFGCIIFKGDKRLLICLVPIAANILFLILGPVCWTRYGLCQIYTLPVLVSVIFNSRVHL